ncbi:MAG: polymer-forming cytoskeletal protein [Hyphomicrobium sp.]
MLPNFRKVEVDTSKNNSLSAPTSLHIASSNPSKGSANRIPDRGVPSIIGQSLQITGNLISRGEVQIEGEIRGDIQGSYVIVGESAHIKGSIIAAEIVVRGVVMGAIRGNRVHLQSTARIEGDVYHQSLAIEQGAYFEGKSRRVEDPTVDFSETSDEDTLEPGRSVHGSYNETMPPTLPSNSFYYSRKNHTELESVDAELS